MNSVTQLEAQSTLDTSTRGRRHRDSATSSRAPIRLGYLVSHPIQYQAPMLRYIAQDPEIDLTVFYMSDMSVHGFDDPQFRIQVKWDVPLLGGYRHVFLNRIGGPGVSQLVRPFVTGLENTFQRAQLDALWLHGYKHQVQLRAIRAARKRGTPILVRGDSSGLETGLSRKISARVLRRLFRVIDAFLYIGKQNREFYSNRGVEDARLFSMPYAVDNEYFQSAVRRSAVTRADLRASLNIRGTAPVVLFAGKLTRGKRPQDLLLAYQRIVGEFAPGSKPYLVFVGEGEERRNLERRIAELHLDRVRLPGFVNQREMPRYYDLCDVFMLPSAQERWGLAVNEAMNAAKPVIISDQVGCAPDLVHAGENGFIVPAGDIDRLASALALVLRDQQMRAAMGRASLRVVSNFSFEQDLWGLKQALQHVVKSGVPINGSLA